MAHLRLHGKNKLMRYSSSKGQTSTAPVANVPTMIDKSLQLNGGSIVKPAVVTIKPIQPKKLVSI